MSAPPAPPRPLSRKLTLPLVLVGACLAALGVAGIYALVSSQMEGQLRQRAATLAQGIGYAAENLEHTGELQRIVSATGAEREINLLVVAGGHDQRIIASNNPSWRQRPLLLTSPVAHYSTQKLTDATLRAIELDPLKVPANWLVYALPVQLHDLSVNTLDLHPGVVLVALDTGNTRAAVWQLTALAAGGFLIALIGVFTLHYLNLRRSVLRPLSELARRHFGAPGMGANLSAAAPADEIEQLDAALTRTFAAITAARIERDRIEFAFNQHVIIGVTDPRGQIVYANDRFCNVSGYGREELLGQNHRILNSGHHPHTFFNDLYQTLIQGRIWRGEICNRAKNGQLYWVDTTIIPELDTDGKPIRYVALRSEITERKAAETALRESNRQLSLAITQANQLTQTAESAARAKADFLANMSHEIRTPMNGVIGMLSLLLDSPLSAEQRQFVTVANASGETLLTLINDILDFSKIEAGHLVIESTDLDLNELLNGLLPIFKFRANESQVQLVNEIHPAVPTRLKGDPVRIAQVLNNLLGNALKFTAEGEIRLTVTAPRLTPNEVTLRFAVRDTGLGIPAEKLPLLFTKFSQVDTSTTRKYGGTGLGLAICKQLAELMGGEVGVNSQAGQGSEFWFTARLERQPPAACPSARETPLAVSPASQPPAPADEAQKTALEPGAASEALNSSSPPAGPGAQSAISGATAPTSAHILVAEDNETNQLVVRSLLQKFGYTCDTVETGAAAIRALSTQSYALVLMDIQMPEMDGAEATRQIRAGAAGESSRHLPIIAITAHALMGDREHCLAAGMNDYLRKPIEAQALNAMVAHWLAEASAPQPLA